MRDTKRRATGVVRMDAWTTFPWLHAGFSTREGGSSTVYGEGDLNLGWTPEDAEEAVAENRRAFVRSVSGKVVMELVTIKQFHSGLVCAVEAGHAPLATEEGRAVLRGDGLMTGMDGILLGVQTADCVPVLVADTRTHAVAAFHAGWRGTQARIVERGMETMRLQYGSRPEHLIAAIGPAIGPCCFAVGEEVMSEFESQFLYAPELFSRVYVSDTPNPGPQIYLDLFAANRRQLIDAGVAAEKISIVGECTACTRLSDGRRKYFSHRAEQGRTGRMLSVIGACK